MPRVTALRPARPERVLVELDGRPWRTVPVAVAARSGLSVGLDLDRARLRALRRELRRSEALAAAAGALARRDRSEQDVQRILQRKGAAGRERDEAVAVLRSSGAIDAERFAALRAASLCDRGWGNRAIAVRLEHDGVGRDEIQKALAGLAPEADRALRVAARRGRTAKTARWLAGRGFEQEAVEAAIPAVAENQC